MNQDPNTLQAYLDKLSINAQSLQQAFRTKTEAYDQLAKEIEQHRGALGYNNALIEDLRKQLAELAAQKQATTPSP